MTVAAVALDSLEFETPALEGPNEADCGGNIDDRGGQVAITTCLTTILLLPQGGRTN